MDRYQRVEKPRTESAIKENEIRITTQGMIRNYINYASSLLQDRQMKEIVLKGMGQAISKAVAVAEVIKKRNRGLHQDTKIDSISIVDVWEPIEEGLVPLEMTRHVSVITVTLSLQASDKDSPGYQAPAYVENIRPPGQHRQPLQAREFQALEAEDSNGQGQGRGRGRGWGRGGYGHRGGYERGYGGRFGGGGGNGGRFGGGYNGVYGGGYGEEYDENHAGGGYGGYHNNDRGPKNGGWNHDGGRGGGRGRGGGYQGGGGFERGRGGNGRGRGRMSGRGRTDQD